MPKKLQIAIPTPCHENWESMTPDDKGRFCASCQKTVVDFSTMSDTELIRYFQRPAGSLCGNFRSDQLDRDFNISPKKIPWARYFIQFAIPAFLLSMKANVQSGQLRGKIKATAVSLRGDTVINNRQVLRREHTLSGIVIDEQSRPIPFASIKVNRTSIGVSCDEEGRFQLVTKGIPRDSHLKISALNHKVGIFSLDSLQSLDTDAVIRLTPSAFRQSTIVVTAMGINRHQEIKGYTATSYTNSKTAPLKGVIIDEKNRPIPYASVLIVQTNFGVVADSIGKFTLNLDKAPLGGQLQISAAGYQAMTSSIDSLRYLQDSVSIQLVPNTALEEVVVVSEIERGVRGMMMSTRVYRTDSLKDSLFNVFRQDSIKVYPNPVRSGGSLTIDARKVTAGKIKVELYTNMGQQVYKNEMTVQGKNWKSSFSVPTLVPGIYFLEVYTEEKEKPYVTKIMVK